MSLKEKLDSGGFAVLAELEPPKGVDVSAFIDHATGVKGRVDAFVVPEMANAVMKMSSLGGSLLLANRGFETVMQLCCRDRNRLALQADLLAASALGVANVMAIEGENPTYGDHHQARPVYDLDLAELLEVIGKLTAGRDMAGIELSGSPRFTVGSTVNAGAVGTMKQELEALDQKIASGAEFFITPPVFDPKSLSSFMKQLNNREAKIIPNVLLLKSVGMARYINRHLKHVHIPDEMITRIQKAPDRVDECTRIASELIGQLKEEGYAGVMISPLGWEEKLPRVLAGIA